MFTRNFAALLPTICMPGVCIPGICMLAVASAICSHATAADTGNMLISPQAAKKLLDNDDAKNAATVLDVRPAADFQKEHIPGAVRIDLPAWKQKSLEKAGRRDTQYWADAIGSLGISNGTPVIVYGENPTNAARAWWLLKYAGAADVKLLDGGLAGWKSAGLPLTDKIVQAKPAAFKVDFQTSRLVEIEQLKPGAFQIVDTRSDAEFNGDVKGGHLPGAVHLEWKDLLNGNGEFLPAAELKKIFAAKGISSGKPTATYCQSGGRASLTAFALELAGISDSKNYYCGWSEYSKSASKLADANIATSVAGIVTLDSAPVAGATVTFSLKSGGKKVTATTNKLGQFTLVPSGAGEHVVTIQQAAGDGAKPGSKPEQSTLRTLIVPGSNEFNIQLVSQQ